MKNKLFIAIPLLIIALFLVFGMIDKKDGEILAAAPYSCSLVSGTCSGVVLLNVESATGGHAELPTQANYGYKLCCSGTAVGNSCSATYHDTMVYLSASTNAHVEEDGYNNYANEVCLSDANSYALSCDYTTSCTGTDAFCVASISGATNAHIGGCDTYSIKICCGATKMAVPLPKWKETSPFK
jgi:hypothetical protein